MYIGIHMYYIYLFIYISTYIDTPAAKTKGLTAFAGMLNIPGEIPRVSGECSRTFRTARIGELSQCGKPRIIMGSSWNLLAPLTSVHSRSKSRFAAAIVPRSWIASQPAAPGIALRLKPRKGITGTCIGLALSLRLAV